jgi:hypothetical protein
MQDLDEIRRRFDALREWAQDFRSQLGDLVAPLKGLMAELDEIEATLVQVSRFSSVLRAVDRVEHERKTADGKA